MIKHPQRAVGGAVFVLDESALMGHLMNSKAVCLDCLCASCVSYIVVCPRNRETMMWNDILLSAESKDDIQERTS
jgi:hypothetical protein